MRSLILIDPALGELKVSEEDLLSFTDEQLTSVTGRQLQRLFTRAWKLADGTLSEISESPKPDVIPIAYKNSLGKWQVFLSVDE
jgi:hypothetical protein